ncbi:MAG: nickel pincer cofactor biosynthesis protein LarB, partial [Candidatus Fermentibacteraceae bacterium]|nr:nickel pincer cofactor biosynthesis protein LarB [Candidatus Fermentibacteraceae bacterium]
VSAGTSDLHAAEEAAVVLEVMKADIRRIYDIGVAGLHRLSETLPVIRAASVCLVFAGMDAALPTVLGGLYRGPVVAVPTSTGYGTAFGGVTALLSMLNSCSPGICVMNIDNGLGAAAAALRMIRSPE